MILSTLIQGLPDVHLLGSIDPEILGISTDSRTIRSGYLFAALPGNVTNGHQYISQAIDSGASALLVDSSHLLPSELPIPVIRAHDLRRVLSTISARHYGFPSREMKMIGVTGTNGKTTTTYLIDGILRHNGISGGVIGTIGARFANREVPTEATTPEAPQLHKILSEMRHAGVQVVAMEVSSHSLALHRVTDIDYEIGIFTNLTQDHLDFHGTLDRYLAAKGLLFQSLVPRQSSTPRVAVINRDDPVFDTIRRFVPTGCHPISYGFHPDADLRVRIIEMTPMTSSFEVTGRFGVHEISLPTPGRHNIMNFSAAFCACCAIGIEPSDVAAAATRLSPAPGRMEQIDVGQPFLVVVDYAHSPDALDNLLSSLRPLVRGRLICVFGCGGDRDRTKRPRMAEAVARHCDHAIVTSDNPRTEPPEEIIVEILPGIPPGFPSAVMVDRREAIFEAIRMAERDDAIVIAGKGHEDYQIIGRTKHHFDDREEARNALIRKGFTG